MLEYNHTHQCVRCGVTRPTKTLKLSPRIDPIILINETVWVCVDVATCDRMAAEKAELATRSPVTKAPALAPLKKLKPLRPSAKTSQVFPLHRSKVKRKKGSPVARLDAKAAAAREGSRERELERQRHEAEERERS